MPPVLIFSKGTTHRDAVFRGLAVPGATHLDAGSDLIATWKSVAGQRFQNYRATFTILDVAKVERLDVAKVERAWIKAIRSGNRLGAECPSALRSLIETGRATQLRAIPVRRTQAKGEQLGC